MMRSSSIGVSGTVFVAWLAVGSTTLAQATPPPAGPDAANPSSISPPAASADDDVVEARRRYQQGVEFYRRNRYEEAVAEFTEAYELWQNPLILYALGQAYEGLSEVNRAIATYRHYLEISPADDTRRAEVETKIRELERLLATVHIQSNVPATIYVDGEEAGTAPGDVRLATGRRSVELRANGYEPNTQVLIVAGGTERSLGFVLEPIPVATTQVVQVDSEPFRFPRPVFYTAAGLTAASAVTWGSVATLSLVRANRYNADPDRTNLQRDRARQAARNADVLLGVTAGLGVATTVIGLLTDFQDEDDENVAGRVTATVEPVVGGAVVGARWIR